MLLSCKILDLYLRNYFFITSWINQNGRADIILFVTSKVSSYDIDAPTLVNSSCFLLFLEFSGGRWQIFAWSTVASQVRRGMQEWQCSTAVTSSTWLWSLLLFYCYLHWWSHQASCSSSWTQLSCVHCDDLQLFCLLSWIYSPYNFGAVILWFVFDYGYHLEFLSCRFYWTFSLPNKLICRIRLKINI